MVCLGMYNRLQADLLDLDRKIASSWGFHVKESSGHNSRSDELARTQHTCAPGEDIGVRYGPISTFKFEMHSNICIDRAI